MPDTHCAPYRPRKELTPPDQPERDIVEAMLRSLARPDASVEEIVHGPKFVAVTVEGRTGLASLLGAQPSQSDILLMEGIVGQRSAQAAELLLDRSPFAVCLGMAALNAANSPEPGMCQGDATPAEELIARAGQGKQVGLVGEFPFTDRLRSKVASLYLFELREGPGIVPGDQRENVLARLDVLAVTGTALLTREMGYYLAHARGATVIVLGPTTPLSPALFSFGVDHLCGSLVTDRASVLDGVRAGAPFKTIKKGGGIRFITLNRKTDSD